MESASIDTEIKAGSGAWPPSYCDHLEEGAIRIMQYYQLLLSWFRDMEDQIETIVIFQEKLHAQRYRGPFLKIN